MMATTFETTLMTRAEYVRILRPQIPSDAFEMAHSKLGWIAANSFLFVLCCWCHRQTDTWYLQMVIWAVHCYAMSSLAFLAHELSHGSIIRNAKWRYLLELWQWGIVLVPPTLWKRIHNHAHHSHASTPMDPDRNFLPSENCKATSLYGKLFYPARGRLRWNPLVGFHFIPYVFRNIIAVVTFPIKPSIVPAMPKYSSSERLRICLELGWIIGLQLSIFAIVGSWQAFILASPLTLLATSTIVMAYIFTNHWLNPITPVADPLIGSTSVVVPKLIDKLHFNFSHHTEHHLFPNINSEYLPLVSTLLSRDFADRYNSVPIGRMWQRLWEMQEVSHSAVEQT